MGVGVVKPPGVGVVGVVTSVLFTSSGNPGTPPKVKVMLPISDVSAKDVRELGTEALDWSARDRRELAAVS